MENVVLKWYPEVTYYNPKSVWILVGTKLDVREGSIQGKAEVSREEGAKVAKKIKAKAYVECSALTQKGLSTAFYEAARAAIDPSALRRRRGKTCLLL